MIKHVYSVRLCIWIKYVFQPITIDQIIIEAFTIVMSTKAVDATLSSLSSQANILLIVIHLFIEK